MRLWSSKRPHFDDQVTDERARLLWNILLILLIVLVPVTLVGLVASQHRFIAAILYGLTLGVVGASFALLLKRRVRASAVVLCSLLSIAVMVVVVGTGRPTSIYAAGFIPLSLMTRATLGPRIGLLAAAIYMLFVVVVTGLGFAGALGMPFILVTPFDEMLAATTFLAVSAILMYVSTGTLERAVARAREAADTERELAAQARALGRIGSSALLRPSASVAEEVVATVQNLLGARWAAIVSYVHESAQITTSGVDVRTREEIAARAPDVVAGRDLGGFVSAPSIARYDLTLPSGPFGTLVAGFADQAAASAAASFLQTAASLVAAAVDRERRHDELVRAHKRDAAGRIAAHVSHDVNNLLAAIAADAWALERVTSGPARELSQQILAATRRGALLTSRLRALTRRSPLAPEAVVLHEEVAAFVARMRKGGAAPTVDIALTHDEPGAEVVIDRGDLEQILEALTSNAIIAMPTGGRLQLHVGSTATQVELRVRDAGVGMDPATRARLFEPFFTTRATAAGLGLALTKEILERLGGGIEVESELGHGTTVKVHLPVASAAPLPAVAPRPRQERRRDVLLVEDDALVRRGVARVLAGGGYRVLEASDGLAALELLAQEPSVCLVLSDIAMPRLGGIELARRVRGEHGLPVVLMSGFSDQPVLDADLKVVAKPFAPSELLEAIAATLGDAPPRPASGVSARPQTQARPDADAHTVLVAMLLHDINNHLSVILPGAEALRVTDLADPEANAIADDIAHAARACALLSRQALRVASPPTVRGPLRLEAIVRGLERPLSRLVGERGRLRVDVGPTAPVLADEGTLERVVVNLVVNARDAIDPGGTVTIRVHGAGLEVVDDGCGIDPAVLPHIFEPFFSTKGKHGTGLGLTVVKTAVEALGGTIAVTSEPGRGSTFTLLLTPVSTE